VSGAPVGNQNAKKAKEFESGLRRALAKDDWKRFNDGCEKVADAFAEGQPWAANFVADRMDGKPAQAIVGDPDQPLSVVQRIERVVIDGSKA
jgi:hypothetical protein